MPAINFQEWKADGVMRGQYTQTIRRTCDKFMKGAKLVFYTGQRTKECRKLGEGVCLGTEDVTLTQDGVFTRSRGHLDPKELDAFAHVDGFKNYAKMWEFFLDRYFLPIEQDAGNFFGYRIWWRIDPVEKKIILRRLRGTAPAKRKTGKRPKPRAARSRIPNAKARRPRSPARR